MIYKDLQGSTRIYGLFHYSLLYVSVKERYYNCEIQRAQAARPSVTTPRSV